MNDLVSKCPHCNRILEKGAVFCVGCGTNLSSGEKANSEVLDVGESGEVRINANEHTMKNKSRSSVSIPFFSPKSFILICLILGGVWGYFEYLQPFLLWIQFDKVKFSLSQGDVNQAQNILISIQDKGKPEFKQMVSDMIKQMDLEKKYLNTENIQNPAINLVASEVVGIPIDLMCIRFNLTNEQTKESLPMAPHYFYLKSVSGRGEVALNRFQDDKGTIGFGDVLARKAFKGGFCVKFVPAIKFDPEGGRNEIIRLVYNNGKDYAYAIVKPTRIMFHGGEFKFNEDWQGGEGTPKFRSASSAPTKSSKEPKKKK